MNVREFRSKVRAGMTLVVDGEKYHIRQIVKFRYDDGRFYIKCYLNDGGVFADDLEENSFILAKEAKPVFLQPFAPELELNGKKYKLLFTAHTVAEEADGEEIFKKGAEETFSDFAADDGSYLSLGISEALDYHGRIIDNDIVSLLVS